VNTTLNFKSTGLVLQSNFCILMSGFRTKLFLNIARGKKKRVRVRLNVSVRARVRMNVRVRVKQKRDTHFVQEMKRSTFDTFLRIPTLMQFFSPSFSYKFISQSRKNEDFLIVRIRFYRCAKKHTFLLLQN
jgi:hypothetical protein